ncbi:MAG: hypothetical protein PVI33_01440 [Candidatus Omnitrophota bacterium]|jgi:hypothetical protein
MFKRKGQSTLEYALIIAVVVAGLLLMQHYVRRGFAGRLKTASDDMGEQFDPSAYTASFQIEQESEVRQSELGRVRRTEHIGDQVSERTGDEDIDAWASGQDIYSD